jgi:hypothetical protein
MRPQNIRVQIDELILHGFDPRQRYAIAEAVRGELAAGIKNQQPTKSRSAEGMDAGSFSLPIRGGADAIGQAIARQVRGRLD